MAVTSVKILHNGWTATETIGSGFTFSVVYSVEVDSRSDGPLIAINADDGTTRIPRPGESYNIGNERDDFAFVKSISPSPAGELLWHVTVAFGPLEPPESPDGPSGQEVSGLDKNLQPTDDPLDEYVPISVSSVNTTRAAQRGAYIGLNTFAVGDLDGDFDRVSFRGQRPDVQVTAQGDNKGYIINGTPIVNSVFTPFDPPPEIDYTRLNVSIEMNLRLAPEHWLKYVNSVNTEQVAFMNAFGDFPAFADPFCARVMSVNYSERVKNGKMFWATRIEILIDNLFTWRPDILDRGYCETANVNASEGAEKKNIVDANGVPLAEPVLLDGHGNQLNTDTHDAVYIRYAVYPEFDFNLWGINDPQGLQQRENN
jgi:hypothetical protein